MAVVTRRAFPASQRQRLLSSFDNGVKGLSRETDQTMDKFRARALRLLTSDKAKDAVDRD